VTEIDVALSLSELTAGRCAGKNVAVFDVLRATTVLGHALAGGASSIVPAETVDRAFEIRKALAPEPVLLCGEREGRKVPGFDLGNSPFEYIREMVGGRTLVFSSTNGSVALSRASSARLVIAASFNNFSACARRIAAEGGAWLFVACGKLGVPSLEDILCAGLLAGRLDAGSRPAGDGLMVSRAVGDRYGRDIEGALRSSSHGRYLESIGFSGDVVLSAATDLHDIVPELRDGRIRGTSTAG
jgi:2-phosphosulfolactate phosphatase